MLRGITISDAEQISSKGEACNTSHEHSKFRRHFISYALCDLSGLGRTAEDVCVAFAAVSGAII